MSRILTFNAAIIIVVVLAGLAFIRKSWSGAFAGLLLVYLVLASIAPVIMVPVGIVIVLWDILNSEGLPGWLNQIAQGPAGKVTGLGNDNGVTTDTTPGGNF